MSGKLRMAPDYRKVLHHESGDDWHVSVVEAGPSATVSVSVMVEHDFPQWTAAELRLFAATLLAAAAVLADA